MTPFPTGTTTLARGRVRANPAVRSRTVCHVLERCPVTDSFGPLLRESVRTGHFFVISRFLIIGSAGHFRFWRTGPDFRDRTGIERFAPGFAARLPRRARHDPGTHATGGTGPSRSFRGAFSSLLDGFLANLHFTARRIDARSTAGRSGSGAEGDPATPQTSPRYRAGACLW